MVSTSAAIISTRWVLWGWRRRGENWYTKQNAGLGVAGLVEMAW